MEPVARLGLHGRVHGVRYPRAAIGELDRAGIVWAGWLPNVHVPDVFGRFRATVHIPRVIPRFDLVFTYGGGPPVVEAYRGLGARECVPVYNAVDPDTHHPADADPRFAGHLAFLGNRLSDREARVDTFFLSVARARPDLSFVLGGSGWTPHELPANVRHAGHVYTHQHNALNCSALAAILDVSRESMARIGYSPATRISEGAGAAACLITDAWEGIESFFEPDREVLVARDGRDVIGYLDGLTPDRAREIGRCARRRALAEHTHEHRAAHVEELLAGGRRTGGIQCAS